MCVLGIYKKLQNMGYMWSYTKCFAFERKVTKGRDTLCFFKDNNHCIIFDNFIYKKNKRSFRTHDQILFSIHSNYPWTHPLLEY